MRLIAGYTQLESLLEEAFGESGNSEALERLQSAVVSNLQRADDAVHRALRSALITAAVFELLSRAAIAEISLWGMRLSELEGVQKLLPVLIAFFFYQALLALASRRLYSDILAQTLRMLHPGNGLSDLVYFLHPFSTIGAESLLLSLQQGKLGRVANRLGFVTALSVLLGLPSLMLYALVRNWMAFEGFDWVSAVAVVTALLLVVRGFMALAVLSRAMAESEETT